MRSQKRFYGGLFVVFFGSLVLVLAALANGPERDLTLVREVPSRSDPRFLRQKLLDPASWPQWFHSLASAEVPGGGPLRPGSEVVLHIDPHKSPWSKFDVQARVTEVTPEGALELRIENDSTGRLTRLFAPLTWRIEVGEGPRGTVVRGISHGHAVNWRSKLFGAIAERIVMHQVFYPDLLRFAELTPTSSPAPQPSSLVPGF